MQNDGADGSYLNQVVYSDYCVILVVGKVNKRNIRICGMEHAKDQSERAKNCNKATSWLAMSANQLFDPFYSAGPIFTGANLTYSVASQFSRCD